MEATPLPAVPKLTSRTIEALAAEATSRQILAEIVEADDREFVARARVERVERHVELPRAVEQAGGVGYPPLRPAPLEALRLGARDVGDGRRELQTRQR